MRQEKIMLPIVTENYGPIDPSIKKFVEWR